MTTLRDLELGLREALCLALHAGERMRDLGIDAVWLDDAKAGSLGH